MNANDPAIDFGAKEPRAELISYLKWIFSFLFQISSLFHFSVQELYNSYLLISFGPNPSFDLFQIAAL